MLAFSSATSKETLLCSVLFETESHYLNQSGLELMIALSQPLQCWNYRYTPHSHSAAEEDMSLKDQARPAYRRTEVHR